MQEINNTHKLFDKVITEDLAQGYKLYALMDRSHLINASFKTVYRAS